jgi:TolA-binding protein
MVTALKDGNKIIAPTSPARAEFKVIEESEQDKLNSQTKHLNSAAARGVIYARAGPLDEAEQELHSHISRHPKDGAAKRAPRTVKS